MSIDEDLLYIIPSSCPIFEQEEAELLNLSFWAPLPAPGSTCDWPSLSMKTTF
jgi:hypothetical protein